MAKDKRKIGIYASVILVIALIVGVVLAIVFVNLFAPKTTTSLAENVLSVSSSGYLSDSNQKDDEIDEYLDDIVNLAARLAASGGENNVEIDTVKILNYQKAMTAYKTMCAFFARELVFTTYTDVYKQNSDAISKDFSRANSAMNSWASYLDVTLEVVSPSDDALSLTWLDCEEFLDTILSNTTDAMSRVMSVYTSCVTSSVLNNDFSSALFKVTLGFMEQLTAENATTTVGASLATVAATYFTVSGEEFIIRYGYDETMKDATADLLESGTTSSYINDFLSGNL